MRILAFGDPLWGDAAHLALYHTACDHEVRTAGPTGAYDYAFDPHETTTDLLARIAYEFAPDVLYFGFPEMYPPPRAVEDSPIPTIAAISDWNLYGPQMEHNLCRFDIVLSDRQATQRLQLHGITPTYLFPMYSHRTHIHRCIDQDRPRDIDVLFLGNLNHAIHRERGKVLEHIARFSEGFRVVIDAGLPPESYAMRLNETKIALNYAVRGEMNLRCFEAPACGALLFVEEENLETFDFLEPGEHCITYNLDNVLDRIRYFIDNEEEREQIAAAGHQRIQQLAAEKRLDMLFNWMAKARPGDRAFHRLPPKRRALADALLYGSSMDTGQRDCSRASFLRLREQFPNDGEVLVACGCSAYDHAAALGNAPAQRDARRDLLRESISSFDLAHQHLPGEAVPLMNLALLARAAGPAPEERYLHRVLEATQSNLGAYLLGKISDPFYAEWRLNLALGTHSIDLLHAAAHTRLAELCLAKKEAPAALLHALEARKLVPHFALPYTLAGRAAHAMGALDEAEQHLAAGLHQTSFDALHRQALIEVWRALGRVDEAHGLAEESVRIFSACPPLAAFVPLFESLR